MAYYLFVGYLFSPDRRKIMKLINLSTGTCKTETTSSETFDGWVEELKETVNAMCRAGMQLEVLKTENPILINDNNPQMDEIFEFVSEKLDITFEKVKDYIHIYINNMFTGEMGRLKLEVLSMLFGRKPSMEEVVVFMWYVIKCVNMKDFKRSWL